MHRERGEGGREGGRELGATKEIDNFLSSLSVSVHALYTPSCERHLTINYKPHTHTHTHASLALVADPEKLKRKYQMIKRVTESFQ